MEEIGANFEVCAKRLLEALPAASEAARRRNAAAFGLAAYIACSKRGDLVTFEEWKGAVPAVASASAIRFMVLVKDGQEPRTLADLLSLKSSALNFAKFIRAGGLTAARRMLREMKLPSLQAEIEEASRQLVGNLPGSGMVGRAKYDATERLYKFHWPQIAWKDLLTELRRRQATALRKAAAGAAGPSAGGPSAAGQGNTAAALHPLASGGDEPTALRAVAGPDMAALAGAGAGTSGEVAAGQGSGRRQGVRTRAQARVGVSDEQANGREAGETTEAGTVEHMYGRSMHGTHGRCHRRLKRQGRRVFRAWRPMSPRSSVDAHAFVASAEAALRILPIRGVAVLADTRLKRLALRAAKPAEELLGGSPDDVEELFDCVARDSHGNIRLGPDGRAVLTTSAQRIQVPLGRGAPKPLRDLARRIRHLLNRVLTSGVPDGAVLEFRRPVVLGNRPDGVPARIQTLHVDLKPGTGFGFVAIVPMEPDTTLLVALHSVAAVTSWQDMLLRYTLACFQVGGAAAKQWYAIYGKERRSRGPVTESSASDGVSVSEEGSDAMSADSEVLTVDGETVSEDEASEDGTPVHVAAGQDAPTAAGEGGLSDPGPEVTEDGASEVGADSGCCSNEEGEEGPLNEATDGSEVEGVDQEVVASFAALFNRHKVVRLKMQPGQIVLLHGSTVHAGDAARPGRWTPRMHVYVQRSDARNATFPLECMDSNFALLFGRWANE